MRKSIARVVRDVVLSRPAILSCLINNVINYSALARTIASEVRDELGHEVSINAVKVALVRLSRELRERLRSFEDPIIKVLSKTALRLETDLAVVTVSREYLLPVMNALVSRVRNARFTQITQGVNTYTIVVPMELLNIVTSLIRGKPIDIIEDQAAIILISPKEILVTPGFVSYVTSILAWAGINITQIISCYLDTILVLNSSDSLKAYTLLQAVITYSRKYSA